MHGTLALAHTDHRRSIAEYNGHDFSIQSFTIAVSLPLGNHFHKRKREVFLVTEGSGYILTKDMLAEVGTLTRHDVLAGSVVAVEPFTAHTFVLSPGSAVVCFSSEAFDPEDMDITPHKLI